MWSFSERDALRRFPGITLVASVAAVVFAALALRRHATFHNETFDLAFYARLAWGLGRGDSYQPLTDSNAWGLHASPVLYLFGAASRALPLVPTMLVVQSVCVALAGVPLARIAARRVGHPAAAYVAIGAYLLYPPIATVATYEFHPGSLALLPLSLALDAFDRGRTRAGLAALAVAVACREDIALVAALCGVSLALRKQDRVVGVALFAAGVSYFAVYMFVIAPPHLPRHGSLSLHFGGLGGSPGAILQTLLTHPLDAAARITTPVKLLYAPRLLAPVAFLALLSPRWLLPAIVPFGINLLSEFPTAPQVHSHYATLVAPFVFVAAAHGTKRLSALAAGRRQHALAGAALAVVAGTLVMHRSSGATPLSRRWDGAAFRRGPRDRDVRALLTRLPPTASVAAPDYILPHVAERPVIQRVWPARGTEYVLLAAEHRTRFAGSQNLWRSEEEAIVRNALARRDLGVVDAAGAHLLIRRGHDPRAFARGRYVELEGRMTAPDAPDLADAGPSVALVDWRVRPTPGGGSLVTLDLRARSTWPADLFFELGCGPMRAAGDRDDPERVVASLPFDGLFSPAHVHVGEIVRTSIRLPIAADRVVGSGCYFGARRIDGSRLDPAADHWVPLPARPSVGR